METINNEIEEMPAVRNAEAAAEKAGGKTDNTASSNINLLMDVSLRVTVELGRTRMQLARIIELKHGSVVELDRLAGDPVDVFVNDHMVARGEVVVVDDKFGVRIIEMVSATGEKVTP
jgi:flagellar motor switch protein FliN/FliY